MKIKEKLPHGVKAAFLICYHCVCVCVMGVHDTTELM